MSLRFHEPPETEHVEVQPRGILFGVDFDGTFSRDPEGFRLFVAMMRARGHSFVLVTGRSNEGQWGAEVRRDVRDLMPIVFAGNGWKRAAAERAGFKVDIWIDDHPEYVAPQTLLLAVQRDDASDHRDNATVDSDLLAGQNRVARGRRP